MALCLVTFVKGMDINVHTCTYAETLAKISCQVGSGESSLDRSVSGIKRLEIAASSVAVIDTEGRMPDLEEIRVKGQCDLVSVLQTNVKVVCERVKKNFDPVKLSIVNQL